MIVAVAGCSEPSDLVRVSAADLMACKDCDITLQHIADLGSEGDTIWPTVLSGVVQTADGRFVVGSSDHPGVNLIYSPSGELIKTFGRLGSGPGEYQPWTVPIKGPGDTLSIVDIMSSRRTLVDSIGTPIRTHRLPTRFRSVVFVDNRMIVQADVRTPDLIGFPLHEIRPEDGSVIRSFGEVGTYQDPSIDGVRVIAAAGDSGIWVAAPNRFAFDYYDMDYTRSHTIHVDQDWFQSHSGEISPVDGPSEPRMLTAWQSDDGILWVIVRVADAEWRPRPPPTEERPPSLEDGMQLFDWILAGVDPATAKQIGRARFDGPLLRGIGDGVLYFLRAGSFGGVSIAAYHPIYRR